MRDLVSFHQANFDASKIISEKCSIFASFGLAIP